MTKTKTTVRRRLATMTVAAAALLGSAAGTAQAAGGDAGAEQAARSAGAASTATESLWFIKPRHTGMSMVWSVTQDRMVQRVMAPGLNPIFSGELYYFHYRSSTGTYVVESNNGGCLDIKDGISKTIGADLSINACDNTQSQDWFSVFVNGGWTLKNRWSGLTATVDGTYNNAPVRQRVDIAASNQRFDMPLYTG